MAKAPRLIEREKVVKFMTEYMNPNCLYKPAELLQVISQIPDADIEAAHAALFNERFNGLDEK